MLSVLVSNSCAICACDSQDGVGIEADFNLALSVRALVDFDGVVGMRHDAAFFWLTSYVSRMRPQVMRAQ